MDRWDEVIRRLRALGIDVGLLHGEDSRGSTWIAVFERDGQLYQGEGTTRVEALEQAMRQLRETLTSTPAGGSRPHIQI